MTVSPESLSVGIDVSTAGFHSGLRRYACSLTTSLAAIEHSPKLRLHLFHNSARGEIPAGLPVERSNVEFALSRIPRRIPQRLARRIEDAVVRPMQVKRRKLDVYHSLYLYQPNVSGVARVMTMHDLVPLVRPDLCPPGYVDWFAHHFRTAANWVDHFLVYSESTRRDLQSATGVASSRIDCVPLGVNERLLEPIDPTAQEEFQNRFSLPRDYFCYLGDFQPRKNLPRLLEAYRQASRESTNLPTLVLAGHASAHQNELRVMALQLGIASRTMFLSDIADADVPLLLGSAMAFVYPSLYEGFGLPPLEAMACGTPTIASNASSIPEVVGDAGLLVNPDSIDEIAHAMVRMNNEPTLRQNLSCRGRERARQFTWERTAFGTADLYARLAAGGRQ